jgi:hypothetical protein
MLNDNRMNSPSGQSRSKTDRVTEVGPICDLRDRPSRWGPLPTPPLTDPTVQISRSGFVRHDSRKLARHV